jgi:3-hydroxypropanoate dehydrogenase
MGSKLSKNKEKKQSKKDTAVAEAKSAEEQKQQVTATEDKNEKVVVVEEKKEEPAPVVEEKKEDAVPVVEEKKEDAAVENAVVAEEKPEEKPTEEKLVEEKLVEEKPAEEKPAEEKTEVSAYSSIPGLSQLFTDAHTAHGFLDKPVDQELLDKAVEMALLAPTAYNCSPMRVVYLQSKESKSKLLDVFDEYAPPNKTQTASAPITAIVCYDNNYENHLPYLMPFVPNVKENVFSKEGPVHAPMLQINSTLQGGYLILAMRALGLDVGPMVAHPEKIHTAFLANDEATKDYTPMFLLNIGYADKAFFYPRAPRLTMEMGSKKA